MQHLIDCIYRVTFTKVLEEEGSVLYLGNLFGQWIDWIYQLNKKKKKLHTAVSTMKTKEPRVSDEGVMVDT